MVGVPLSADSTVMTMGAALPMAARATLPQLNATIAMTFTSGSDFQAIELTSWTYPSGPNSGAYCAVRFSVSHIQS